MKPKPKFIEGKQSSAPDHESDRDAPPESDLIRMLWDSETSSEDIAEQIVQILRPGLSQVVEPEPERRELKIRRDKLPLTHPSTDDRHS